MIRLYNKLKVIAEAKYKDIVLSASILSKHTIGTSKLRILLKDYTFLDIYISASGKYSYHWEQRKQRGLIYRHDNAPDFPKIKTYPKHLHNGNEKNVTPSNLSSNPEKAIQEILNYIRETIKNL